MERTRTSPARAFTLVELIVSVGLFSIVIVIAMSAYLSLISLDRKARATNDVMTNLSFVTETMSRSIRTGTRYDCGGIGSVADCPSGSNYFSFVDENGNTDTYLLDTVDGTIRTCQGASVCTVDSATILTDPRIKVTNLTFYTQGSATGDSIQPRVIFVVSGSLTPDTQSAPVTFSIEGSATQRLIDL